MAIERFGCPCGYHNADGHPWPIRATGTFCVATWLLVTICATRRHGLAWDTPAGVVADRVQEFDGEEVIAEMIRRQITLVE